MSAPSREQLLSEFLGLCERGTPQDVETLLEAHPWARESVAEWRKIFELGRNSATLVLDSQRARRTSNPTPPDPALGVVARIASRTRPSERYRIEGELARGGMGSIQRVWDEDLRRELALKRALPPEPGGAAESFDSRERTRLSRFIEEARVTGQLAHPGIVPVHELGVDAEGRAYFTMKLVQGATLEEVFDRARAGDATWSRTRVLDVLLRVCEAMAYAHSKGVIHRDLKPANVMVGAFGEVHVMDWGLARVLSSEGEDAARGEQARDDANEQHDAPHGPASEDSSSRTLEGDVLGTLAYMSPEQARGKLSEIGPATDVYALGAMLYELLAGYAPHKPPGERADAAELWRRVRSGKVEPLPEKAAPPELAAICERALEPDWRRRYGDMSALAEDLRAYLEGRVVQAYRTGAWAEARKWMQRNRALASALAAGLVAVFVGLVVAVMLRREADQNALAAQASAARAEELARLADERRAQAETAQALAQEQKLAAERAAEETQLVADFQTRILSDLSLADFGRELLAGVREELRRNENSRPASAPSRDALEQALAGVNASNVAQRVLEAQLFEPAVRSIDATYADRPRLAGLLYAPVAEVLRELALYESGERCARAAYQAKREALGAQHRETLAALANLALHLRGLERRAEAEPLLREAIAGIEQLSEEERVVLPTLQSNLALLVGARGEPDEAEALLRAALARQRELLGEQDPATNSTKYNLGELLQRLGRLNEAEPLLRDALQFTRANEGDGALSSLTMWNTTALVVRALGKLDEALELAREGYEQARAELGDAHPLTATFADTLGLVHSRAGRHAEAEPLFRSALAGLAAAHGEDHAYVRQVKHHLATSLRALGRRAEAEPLARASYEGLERTVGSAHRDSALAGNLLATLWFELGRLDEAQELWTELAQGQRASAGGGTPELATVLGNLGALLRSKGDFAGAEPVQRELLTLRRALNGERSPETLDAQHNLGGCLRRTGRPEEALEHYRAALAGRVERLGREHDLSLYSQTGLALTLILVRQEEEAQALLLELLETLRKTPGRLPELAREAASALRDVYRARHEREPAAGFDARAAELESEWLGGR
ncbi:MAG: serine/threonine protein kinase [Planctomycetes bacterium]|nr:serine/threonine protein kinase [Planctomycetota bacterium]